jgi:Viral BACON domain
VAHDSTGLRARPLLASAMHRDRAVLQRLSIRPLAILCLALVAARCGETAVSEVAVAPSGVRCQTGLAAPPSAFPSGGGSVKVVVTAARECSWSLSSEASWIRVSPASGQGEAEATVTAEANDQARSRTGSVVVNDQRIVVAQEAAPCRFTLDRTQTQVGGNGGRFTV